MMNVETYAANIAAAGQALEQAYAAWADARQARHDTLATKLAEAKWVSAQRRYADVAATR